LVFNLIVGTGALALPKAFENAGYILAVILLVVSSFMRKSYVYSYVCATFVIEGMAIANAATQTSRLIGRRRSSITEHDISDAFKIKNRTEVSNMAQLFMGRYGVMILTLVMAVYLFGDLTIYTVTVPKSLMNVICYGPPWYKYASRYQHFKAPILQPTNLPTFSSASINDSANASNTVNWDDPCWPSWPAWSNRAAIYRICVAGFVLLVTPLVVIGVSRTKYLQISTSVCRWTAFILMIILAVISLGVNGTPGKAEPVIAEGFGSLFGTTVYAFMCHHSLPSLITPMKSKKNVMLGVLIVYTCVFLFYVALSMTGAFAFTNILDVYSLNFLHTEYFQTVFYKICDYFLALFPVFTITSSYPIVGCTLLNNSLIFMDYVEELYVLFYLFLHF
uniref:Transmembrane protein 104 homolog (inferred by orthology to a C. elegans protein) n=1 Tax=Anisakis simplex TaxID=6269 RepID=A0A158PPK0_ANISI